MTLVRYKKKKIDKIWSEHLKKKPLFNSKIVCYKSHSVVNGVLSIKCYITEYKNFYVNLFTPELNLGIYPIGVSGIILDDGNNTLIGVRQNVTEYDGYVELIPSGSISPLKSKDVGSLIEQQLIEEFQEETAISVKNIISIEPFCFIFDGKDGVYDICSKIYIKGLLKDLLSSRQNNEYKKMDILNIEKSEVFMQKVKIVPSVRVMFSNLTF